MSVHHAATEALSYLAMGALMPFGRRSFGPPNGRGTPVIFVHGYGHNASAFLPMALYLRRRGFRRLGAFAYEHRPILEIAGALAEFLDAAVPGERVDLIGHSIGGLVARAYIQKLGGHARVRRLVTIATPHGGSRLYRFAGPLREDIRRGGALLADLDALPLHADRVRYLSIGGGKDFMVAHDTHTRHPGAEHRHFPELAHVSLLFSPRVFRAVAEALR